MKKLLNIALLLLAQIALLSCSSRQQETLIPDTDVLHIFFTNHPPPSYSDTAIPFDDFLASLTYQREDADINGDGQNEIILTGEIYPPWAFFAAYSSGPNKQISEVYFLEAFGWYSAKSHFELSAPYFYVDFLTMWGGTGVRSHSLERNIAKCNHLKCDSISFTYYYENSAGDPTDPFYSEFRYLESNPLISGDQIEIETFRYSLETRASTQNICDLSGEPSDAEFAVEQHTLGPQVYEKYVWKGEEFVQVEYREVPGLGIAGSKGSDYSGTVSYLIEDSLPNASALEKLNAYYEFFDMEESERNWVPTLPCGEVNESTKWYPASIPTTYKGLDNEEASMLAAVSNECKLAVWKEPRGTRSARLNEIDFLGRENLTDCAPNFISFQWMDITGSETPELVIISGLFKQNMWIFDVDQNVKLIHHASGLAHGQEMVGVQLQKRENHIFLAVGLPYHKERCLDTFECFSLDKDYDMYIWDDASKSFLLQRQP